MYYLYKHTRLDKNEPFYIGIGKKSIRTKTCHHSIYERAIDKTHRTKYWKNIVNSTPYTIEILYESDSREEIFNKEIELIKLYGRKDLGLGTLVNFTHGGEGTFGAYRSGKKIVKIDPSTNNIVNTYDRIVDAQKQHSNKPHSRLIKECLGGRIKLAYGHVWKYMS